MSRINRFTDFLEVVGYDYAPLAWHLSGVDVDNHYVIVDALKGIES